MTSTAVQYMEKGQLLTVLYACVKLPRLDENRLILHEHNYAEGSIRTACMNS